MFSQKGIPKEILQKYGVVDEAQNIHYTRFPKRSKVHAAGYSLMFIGGGMLLLSVLMINIPLIILGLIVFFTASPFFKK